METCQIHIYCLAWSSFWMILAYTKWHKNEHFLFNINQWFCSSNRIFFEPKSKKKREGKFSWCHVSLISTLHSVKRGTMNATTKDILVEYCRSHIFLGFLTFFIGQGVQMIKTDKLDNYHSKWKERAANFFLVK
jgi:hypothetical protein